MEIDQSNITGIGSNVGTRLPASQQRPAESPTCQSIDWFHEGDERVVKVGDMLVTVRFIGRKGRRARIAITAPAGAKYFSEW